MYETILIDGTDIRVAGVRYIGLWDGALAVGGPRGNDQTFPFRDGDTYVEKPFQPTDCGIDLQILGGNNAGFNDALRAIRRLAKPDSTVTLTRQLSFGTGNESHTALARYSSGLNPELIKMTNGHMTLVMRILSGLWYGSAVTIGTGASTIVGDVRTRKMLITLTNGTNPVLTNSTTGATLTYTGSPGAGGVVIDVEAMTAFSGATNVTQHLSWTPGFFPFTLNAGSQTLALSGGGTVSVAYQPAFL